MSPFDPPEDPKKGQTWVDEAGDSWAWDGTDWVPLDDLPYFSPNSSFRPG